MKASEQVARIEEALSKNAGVQSVSTDGTTIQFNRAQLLAELDYWQRKAAKESGKRKPFKGLNMGGGIC
jgi:hypothetical protein